MLKKANKSIGPDWDKAAQKGDWQYNPKGQILSYKSIKPTMNSELKEMAISVMQNPKTLVTREQKTKLVRALETQMPVDMAYDAATKLFGHIYLK